ncbi:MAG: phage integrase family protein [Lachnospiraceae bacterium]|nr:phage integrase family protein [Lachnospiraceae bacterium]
MKWCDILDSKNLHICREERKDTYRAGDTWKDEYKVVEHTKTHSDRIIPLVPAAISILNHIRSTMGFVPSSDDFIFVRADSRITSRQINYTLEKACCVLGISIKRSHKIRKTVASRLSSGNIPLNFIRELLGHASLNTTLGYMYNPLSEKETYHLMSKVL